MKEIRKGNDIVVTWSLKREGEPFILEGLSLTLYLKSMYDKKQLSDYSVSRNKIIWTFYGKDQTHTGNYSLELVVNKDEKGMMTTDACNFVRIVSCSCRTSNGWDDCGIKTEVVDIESEVEYGGSIIVVDKVLSPDSENAIANNAVYREFGKYTKTEELSNLLSNKVDKESGKGLSTEDFTTALKNKLNSLSNYDDKELSEAVATLRKDLDNLVSGDTTTAIKTFNEIIAFLDGIQDTESLDSIIASIEQQIEGKQDKLVSGTNIKTINGKSILGEGNIEFKVDVDLSGYVTKEEGKGLSANDYTDEDKEKVDSLENYDDTEIQNKLTELSAEIADVDSQFAPYRAYSNTPLTKDSDFGGYSSNGSIAHTGTEHSIMQMFKVKKGYVYRISANALTLGFENVDRIFFCESTPKNNTPTQSILTIYDLPSEGKFSKEYVAPSDGYIGVAQKYAASFQLMSEIAVYEKNVLIDFESQIKDNTSKLDTISSSLEQYKDNRIVEKDGEFGGYSIDGKALESGSEHSISLVYKVTKGVTYNITADALSLGFEAYDRIFFSEVFPQNNTPTQSILTIYDLSAAGAFTKEYIAPKDGYISVNVKFATYTIVTDVAVYANDSLIDFSSEIKEVNKRIEDVDSQLDIYRAFSTTPMQKDSDFGGYSTNGSLVETGEIHSIMHMFKVKKGASYLITANALTLGFENVDRIFFCESTPKNNTPTQSILTIYDLPTTGVFRKEFTAPSDGYVGVAQKYAENYILMSDIAVYGKGELIDFESQINELRYQRGTSDSSYLAIPVPQLAQVNFITTKLPTTKTEDIHAIMEFDDKQGNVIRKNIILNAQGTSSLAAAKKNFAIDIVDANYDDSHSIKFGDWVAQDSFHLKAYMWDGIRVKPMAAYDFWESILKTRGMTKDRAWKRLQLPTDIPIASNAIDDSYLQLDSGAKGHPSGFPIILSVNGEFYGIYCWQLKKHRDNYHQKKSKAEHIHLDGYISNNMLWGVNGNIDWQKWAGKKAESETNANYEGIEVRNPKGLILVDGTEYDADFNTGEFISSSSAKYDSSNEDMVRTAKVRASIEEFSRKVYAASQMPNGDEKKSALAEIFDIDSFIDYIIFSQITGNQDGYVKNWQWTTYDGIKWAVNAYDLDGIWGWDSWNFFNPFSTWGGTGTKPVAMMVDNYKSEIKARYAELRNMGIITLDKIMQPLYNYVKVIGIDYYDKEYEKWEGYGVRDNLWRFESWMAESIRLTDILMDYNS